MAVRQNNGLRNDYRCHVNTSINIHIGPEGVQGVPASIKVGSLFLGVTGGLSTIVVPVIPRLPTTVPRDRGHP